MLDSVLGENVSEFIGGLIGGAVARAAGADVMGQLAGKVAGTAIEKSLSDNNNEVDENQGWAATFTSEETRAAAGQQGDQGSGASVRIDVCPDDAQVDA